MGLDHEGHKRFKATFADYDFVRSQSEDTCLFCLSKQQAAALLAFIEPMAWKTRWFSPTQTPVDTDWLAQFVARLETELMTDHCDLASSITEVLNQITTINENITTINNNVTEINTDLTVINENITTINNNVLNINTNIVNLAFYQNITNVTNINLYFTYTTSSEDKTNTEAIARYNAFCYAMVDFVCSACAKYGQIFAYSLEDYLDVLEGVEKALTLFDPFIALAAMPPNSSLIDIIGEEVATTAVSDSDAISEIACAMATYLRNLIPSQGTFILALDDWMAANPVPTPPPAAPAGWTNSQVIAGMVRASLVANGAFQAWATTSDYWFQAILATEPTEYYCLPCGEVFDWCDIPQTWDFAALSLLPWTIRRGTLTAGVGILGVTTPDDPANYTFDVEFFLPETGCTFFEGNKLNFYLRQRPGANGQFIIHFYRDPDQETPDEVAFATNGNEQTIPWTLSGTYYKSIRVYPVTNGGYFGFVSLATSTYAALHKITLTET